MPLSDEQKTAIIVYRNVAISMLNKMFEIGNSADDRSLAVEQLDKIQEYIDMTPEVSRRNDTSRS